MRLRDMTFSDLLLYGNGKARYKQSCSHPMLHPIPDPILPEAEQLRHHIMQAMLAKHEAVSVRTEWDGLQYRVAQTTDVEQGTVWFLRRLAVQVPSLESLNTGDGYGSGHYTIMQRWLLAPEQSHGLILISGPQSSGKTTLASAYVKERLSLYGGHGVTFENPAELPLAGDCGEGGCCFQVEINSERELEQQIERAHRYASPNIIFIGEIKTRYAAREALRVALGSNRQIVVATIHGVDIVAALQRLSNWVKEFEGENGLDNLASALMAVIQLSLEENNGVPTLQIPQLLLLPAGNTKVHSIRAKLRNGQFQSLIGDINEQNSRITAGGLKAL